MVQLNWRRVETDKLRGGHVTIRCPIRVYYKAIKYERRKRRRSSDKWYVLDVICYKSDIISYICMYIIC